MPVTKRVRVALALALVAGAAAVAFALLSSKHPEPPPDRLPSVLVREADGFRYEYHVPTGRESLFDVAADPRHLRNVIQDHRDEAAKCRKALEEENKVQDLEELRKQYADQIRRLKALGYL